jgi:hypothetical protein
MLYIDILVQPINIKISFKYYKRGGKGENQNIPHLFVLGNVFLILSQMRVLTTIVNAATPNIIYNMVYA